MWIHNTIDTPTRPENRSPVCGYTTQLTHLQDPDTGRQCVDTQHNLQNYKTRKQVTSVWIQNTIDTPTRPKHRSPVRGYTTQLTHLQHPKTGRQYVDTQHNSHTYKTRTQVASAWIHNIIYKTTRPKNRSPVCGYTTQLTHLQDPDTGRQCVDTQHNLQNYKTRKQVTSVWIQNTIDTPTRPKHRSPVRGYTTQLTHLQHPKTGRQYVDTQHK